MKKVFFILFLTVAISLNSLDLEDYYVYIGEYHSIQGFSFEWFNTYPSHEDEGSIVQLKNGVFQKHLILQDNRFSIEKKESNSGGYRLNIRENGDFICNLTNANIEYIFPDINELFLEENNRNERIIFLPDNMVVLERIVEDEDLQGGLKKYQYVIYKKVGN